MQRSGGLNDKITRILRGSPKVNLQNVKPNKFAKKGKKPRRGQHARSMRSDVKYNHLDSRLAWEPGTLPSIHAVPKYGYNRDSHLKRDYEPLTLWRLQRMIDLGRINPDEPIDLTTLINSSTIMHDVTDERIFGVFLVEQGADIFKARVNIEVQIANEMSIAAIEKNGGTITTAFYDHKSIEALSRPVNYFLKGFPIHKRQLPPQELVEYYCDQQMRGYLSDPAEIQKSRIELANKFGYPLPDISQDQQYSMLMTRKDPRQVFFGLSPGWLVNLADKVVIKPEDSEFMNEYLSQ